MRASSDAVRMSNSVLLMLVPLFAELWQTPQLLWLALVLLNTSWPRAICARFGFRTGPRVEEIEPRPQTFDMVDNASGPPRAPSESRRPTPGTVSCAVNSESSKSTMSAMTSGGAGGPLHGARHEAVGQVDEPGALVCAHGVGHRPS